MFKDWDWFSGNIMIGMFLLFAIAVGGMIKSYHTPPLDYKVVYKKVCPTDDVFHRQRTTQMDECDSSHSYDYCVDQVNELLCDYEQKVIWLDTREEGEWE